MTARIATVERETKETKIRVEVNLDGTGVSSIHTPLPFLSHMLDQIARHGSIDLTVHAEGDVEIDGHHTTEALVTAALDLSGRPFFVWRVPLPKAKIGTWDVELAEVFFEAFARTAQANLHMVLHEGQNLHHIVEISFKAFAKALRMATELDPRASGVPSTKGMLV
jgi:imidazoleglycerol-phosphate dehydratase